jgi:nucleotide-binding universal stress UspA family protein
MKILVAVDPADTVLLPVTRAAEMARKEGAELTLLAVVETLYALDMESAIGAQAIEVLRQHAAKALDAAKAKAKGAGVEARALLEEGDSPADRIVEAAKQGGADLIVTGTRGKKGAARLLLGSVASKVVTLAHCSVLVVR